MYVRFLKYLNSHSVGEAREKVQCFHDLTNHVSKALVIFLAVYQFSLQFSPPSLVCVHQATVKPQETSLPSIRELNTSVKVLKTGSILIMQRFQL